MHAKHSLQREAKALLQELGRQKLAFVFFALRVNITRALGGGTQVCPVALIGDKELNACGMCRLTFFSEKYVFSFLII